MPYDTLRERVEAAVKASLGVDKPDFVVRCRVVKVDDVVDAVLRAARKGVLEEAANVNLDRRRAKLGMQPAYLWDGIEQGRLLMREAILGLKRKRP